MASGCRCVASDCPRVQPIRDGMNNRLLPNDANPETWAEVVSVLLAMQTNAGAWRMGRWLCGSVSRRNACVGASCAVCRSWCG